MCGICGYIGASLEPEVTFRLTTFLFDKTEVRGEDAAGMWGVVEDKKVIYHKEPVKSSVFVRQPMWQKVGEENPDLLLCHARAASMGVGVPSINKNNHPFISADGTIGLVHNGRIPDVEYRALKKKYPTVSACDSEILLRIFEAGQFAGEDRTKEFQDFDAQVATRLTGMKDIWSFLSLGHMAVAIGETQEEHVRRLWLFRNKHRSLWLADMRKPLGQVFFFSAPQIWREAVDKYEREDPAFKKFTTGGVKLIELPTEEIWMFNVTPEITINSRKALKRFEVCASGTYQAWHEEQIAAIPAGDRRERIELITELDDDEKPKEKPQPQRQIGFHTGINTGGVSGGNSNGTKYFGTTPRPNTPSTGNSLVVTGQTHTGVGAAAVGASNLGSKGMSYPLSNEDLDSEGIEKLCDSMAELAGQVKDVFQNRLVAGTISEADYNELKQSLEQAELDMTGILNIMDR